MTIKIEGTEMQSFSQLTPRNQELVGMLPNALPWININIANTTNTLAFANEDGFMEQIGLGLSGTSYVALPNIDLTLDIKKLLDVDTQDVHTLSTENKAHQASASQVSDVLNRNHLVTDSELTKVASLFEHGKSSVPFSWNSGLQDSINCYNSLMYIERYIPAKQSIKTQAANWALTGSRTLTGFGLNYAAYLHVATHIDSKHHTVEDALATLNQIALNRLDCPLVTFELDQTTLQNAFVQWGDAGNTLGFSSIAAGVLSIALNIDWRAKGTLEEKSNAYITQLQGVLCEQLATDSYVSQAGQYRHYLYSLPERQIIVNVDEVGCLSVYSDLPIPKTKAGKVGIADGHTNKPHTLSIN
ncbi:hypothetical protein [Vibrio sp. T11.5]|uniref:hypothetical protein n=1 Tax=Vibrio sp. T11.5 TaxID=2998836 RepID=UPI0022CDAD45|nr:hypothetical protein [Vibrio sp. T11.5]MDA0117894.1 hypothetical protein [Vibrio sp. T11.5]